MELVDAHCHFDFPRFDGERDQVLAEARSLGVSKLVVPGVRRADWGRVMAQSDVYEGVFYCLGIHPWFVAEHGQSDLELLREQLRRRPAKCVAVGECGLDRLRGDLTFQLPWFEAQLDLAMELDLALVVHSVRAHDEVAAVLRRKRIDVPVLVHGFAGSYQQAVRLVELGCYIGVGGVITHPRAVKSRDAVAQLPLSSLVLETDAPDMAPAGVAKGRNSPTYLPRILQVLAEIRNETVEGMAPVLLANASELYRWV